jgi:hypothetical protein
MIKNTSMTKWMLKRKPFPSNNTVNTWANSATAKTTPESVRTSNGNSNMPPLKNLKR